MTKQEQRNYILNRLYWMKKYQDERAGLKDYEQFKTIADLRKVIRKAMEIKPVDEEVFVLKSYFRGGRNYARVADVFSDEDNAKVETVIRRMEEQGFIRLLHVGGECGWTAVEVLKTK